MFSIPGKIPIKIYPFFWLLAAIIGWVNSGTLMGTALWIGVIVVSVLIHEFGHALTALLFGQQAYIELVGLGGVTHRLGARLPLWKEFIIVLNGPLAGFLLFLGANYLRMQLGNNHPHDTWFFVVYITTWANLFWTVINLLPIHPLDGGKLLSIVLEGVFGMRGVKLSLLVSSILAVLIALFFFLNQALLAGSIFLLLAFESYRAWQSSLVMSSEDKNEDLQQDLKKAEEDIHLAKEEEAIEKLQAIREKTSTGVIYQKATEYLASILSHQGSYKEAYALLEPIKNRLSPDSIRLMHQLAYRNADYKVAVELGNKSYQALPNYDTALINAFSYAILGQAQPSVGWLQRAISDGLPHSRMILDKSEFDAIRDTPVFQEFLRNKSN